MKLTKKQKLALQSIHETAEFWLPIFNEEALNCVDSNCAYANPWFPVEFARRILELAEFALKEQSAPKDVINGQKMRQGKVKRQKMQRTK